MAILSEILDGVICSDRDGAIALVNPAAEELLGVRAFHVLGQDFALVAESGDPEVAGAVREDHENVVRDRAPIARTLEVPSPDRDLLYIKLNTSEVLDYKGEFAGVMTVLQDITKQYKTDQRKNQYLSIVAHELRTPLTGIKTFSTLMAKGSLGELSEQQSQAVESIREQSVRLEHQIDKLINLGHIDSNEYARDLEQFGVNELIQEAVSPFEVVARDGEIELEGVPLAENVEIQADRTDVRRALGALIENAVKFTPAGGMVTVSATIEDGAVRFEVRDTGIGVNPRYHRRVFEKFFQVEDPLTRHHGGAGLGLFVAQGIMAAHESGIEIDSDLGLGATFRFTLPLIEKSVGASTAECLPASST